ncbi:phosphodiester glycosidase family protein [Clostridium botulinum]|uniref:Exopolysaccharide biosynthesis protein n=1 Tax=Clostridium botulinum TaxID=1491 RepID=A0A9Q1ZBM0_CLOBO|nr:phosphodiester glycosidase family protein [Clostridium botulinum]KEI00165.1 hypothetical protein Z953_10370 [Clostridium botulinum D str. 16868]KEI01632.1 hypothetical protein Y848_09330 [Clostridium botulinum C/D str. Sp77]KLU76301.1 exopolysaccharide biosynthesis protein [Clostridium botulinum V891]KOA73008.1 exopolysaccharide biosynthesis protein [Clostridium botulinum]KOA80761.1 exopolysaccharide biosynthesis protein [Clostridium botulinum]
MNKKKSKFKIIKFLLLEFVFCCIFTPIIAFHGPFNNVKDTLVGMSMTTMTHKWIAKLFLSDSEIQDILNENCVETLSQSKEALDNVHITSNGENNIKLSSLEGSRFKVYLLEISNPKKVRVGYAKNLGKVGEPTSEIAKEFNAIAAINGGSFKDETSNGTKFSGTGAYPQGVLMSAGKIIWKTVKPNTPIEIIGINYEGKLIVGKYTINELKALNCKEALCYDPFLVVNGKKAKIKGDGGYGMAPRTAIGQKRDGTILFLVADGTVLKRDGLRMDELQDILYEKGAYTAANLDGGSSVTMYHDGEVINNPCDSVGERPVPSIFYVEP